MSSRTPLPAERRHTGVSLYDEPPNNYLNGYSSGTQESALPLGHTISDAFSQVDPDVKKDRPTEAHSNVALTDSPAQLAFDDLIGSSLMPRSLPVTPPYHQGSLESPMVNLRLENHPNPTHKSESHISAPQQQSTDFKQSRQRPELSHTPRSTTDTRKLLGKISELEEVDPYGESPFEAARRAQRQADRDAAKSQSPSRQTYTNGRFPSIRPGEIMPSQFLRPTIGLPSFFPPSEAPPFPPPVHTPIRPAHFPPNLHPTPSTPEPARASSQQRPSSQHLPQIPRQHSHRSTPPPSHPLPPPPVNLDGQPPLELLRSHSQPVVPRSFPPQPTRPYSHQTAVPPIASQHSDAPRPSRRQTLTPRDAVPPGLAPNGQYPAHGFPPPQHHPHHSPSPPSQSPSPSQHHPPGPPSQSQPQYHHPIPPHSAPRDPHRQSLQSLSSQSQFVPRKPSPVRLPSQNVPTPQALGNTHTPPMSSSSPRPDNSRPPRMTPKPVMPQLLAPLVAQEPNLTDGGASPLQRSVSSVGDQKGGFLAKTKSILRKRTSTTGIKAHGSGAMSFAPTPTMPNLMEENDIENRKLGQRLSRKK